MNGQSNLLSNTNKTLAIMIVCGALSSAFFYAAWNREGELLAAGAYTSVLRQGRPAFFLLFALRLIAKAWSSWEQYRASGEVIE